MDLLEKIGPVVGIAAFLGLAVLVFLLFQQSREIRRLRQWAGRAPERAEEAAEASQAAAEARGDVVAPAPPRLRDRVGGVWDRVAAGASARWRAVDRRLPLDARILLALLAAAAIAAGVLTKGFGLVEDERGEAGPARQATVPPEVAVLNATQMSGVQGVPGLAGRVAAEAVRPTPFKVTHEGDAPGGVAKTVVAYDGAGAESQAQRLARELEDSFGDIPVEPMDQRIRGAAKGAPLALVIGQEDAGFQ